MRKKKQRMQKTNRIGIKISTTVVVILFAVLSYKTVTLHQKASEYQATLDQYEKNEIIHNHCDGSIGYGFCSPVYNWPF